MSAWIESHQSLRNHYKTRKLARSLGVSIPTAIGHLHCLWWWALEYAQDGDLSRFDSEDIAELAAGYEGDPDRFLEALISAGFVDAPEGDGLRLHDWMQYAGKLVQRREQDAARKRAERARPTPPPPSSPTPPPDVPPPGANHTVAHATLQPDVQRMSAGRPEDVLRNRTQPYPTEPDQPQHAGVLVGGGGGDLASAPPVAPPPALTRMASLTADVLALTRIPPDQAAQVSAVIGRAEGAGLTPEDIRLEAQKLVAKAGERRDARAAVSWSDLDNWLARAVEHYTRRYGSGGRETPHGQPHGRPDGRPDGQPRAAASAAARANQRLLDQGAAPVKLASEYTWADWIRRGTPPDLLYAGGLRPDSDWLAEHADWQPPTGERLEAARRRLGGVSVAPVGRAG